ncbi:MAG: hypothetical protein PX481_12795 [Microcystis sp. M53603_WE2]|nr:MULTISPECIES: hypothetical protein [unclassified Microcystis]MDJ0530837.1 hypothetical protein [Microcystis sp. M53600_WE12]MDJ0544934.1 hypothetical protein [Microcystis sp. M53601_WE4]MDJ0565848.1 hypothetical protein [Microcystis sp. M49629_WE12]MCZ8027548.1 hypothetical protein [Microcystis sp. LE19-10.1B]MDJ0539542.1 hypothetical protein [Microcystis sp. M53603_WE2]
MYSPHYPTTPLPHLPTTPHPTPHYPTTPPPHLLPQMNAPIG